MDLRLERCRLLVEEGELGEGEGGLKLMLLGVPLQCSLAVV